MTTTTTTLHPHHQAMLEASGISPTIAAQRGYRTITDRDELARLGFAPYQCQLVPALLIPGTDPAGRNGRYQIRPDRPRLSNGKALRYESQGGSSLWLDAHPAIQAQLSDVSVPLWVTEGCKKADAAISAGLCCISIQGVWSWRCLADWAHIALKGRTVCICFDSDVTTKPEVQDALQALTAFLTSLGAKVRIVTLPAGEGGAKTGLDDYLAAGHTAADVEALAGPVTTLRDLARDPDGDEAQEITRLRERADALQARNEALQRSNAQLGERDALLRRALRNPEVREEVPTALALVEVTTTIDGDPKQRTGWQKLYRPKVAEIANISEATVSRHFKRLAALNVHRRKVRNDANGRSRLWAGSDPEMDVLRRLAYAEPVDGAATVAEGRRRDHGKFRWQCSEHPDAKVRTRVIRQCAECGALCDRVRVEDGDEATLRDQLDLDRTEDAPGQGECQAPSGEPSAPLRDQVDLVFSREGDQVDLVATNVALAEETTPPIALPHRDQLDPVRLCSDCGRHPPVPFHPRCQPCILARLPARSSQVTVPDPDQLVLAAVGGDA